MLWFILIASNIYILFLQYQQSVFLEIALFYDAKLETTTIEKHEVCTWYQKFTNPYPANVYPNLLILITEYYADIFIAKICEQKVLNML